MAGPDFAYIMGMDNLVLKAIQFVSKLLAVLGLGLQRDFQARLQEQKHQADLQLEKEIAQITQQVAEDIRGPLMALTTLTHLSHEMAPDKKELLQVAVNRVRGIIDDLAKNTVLFSNNEMTIQEIEESSSSELISVIEPLLKEYKFSHPQAQWALHNHLNSEHALIDLNTVQLQRVLSHLLNNAVEAVPENEALIEVTLMERTDHYLLQIIDNGCGIPEELLPKVAEETRKTMASLGGDLQIRSREGVGTQVILLFPKKFNSQEAQVI